jgi:hypothetical protein
MKTCLIAMCLFVTAIVSLTGCGSSIKYTTIEPKPTDIIGTYQITSDTASNLVAVGYFQTNASISFYANGTFEAFNLPACWRSDEPLYGPGWQGKPISRSYDSGSGSWKIFDEEKYDFDKGLSKNHSWSIMLHFIGSKSLDYSPIATNGWIGSLMLKNESPPYILHFIVGDPDEGEGLEFEKVADVK